MKGKNTIRLLAEEAKVSLSKMARAVGITRQNMNCKLNNKSDLSLEDLVKFAEYLDYDVVLVPKSRGHIAGTHQITSED